ncbi:hypothetical protein TNIN_397891 [Trichonephila inaurata madagascariensis]|uniref:Uncharacterized protein n=1 Tax=Trichonephila inaurata madagascariensis TaxID=2747483 RepID=A0A8X7CEE9_9ARAC|nr:hypothetical protein TNIN_397891 [Trichonephila inaurata madagascariensis]
MIVSHSVTIDGNCLTEEPASLEDGGRIPLKKKSRRGGEFRDIWKSYLSPMHSRSTREGHCQLRVIRELMSLRALCRLLLPRNFV